jgi:hypothetical protein
MASSGNGVPVKCVIPINQMFGNDEDDLKLLQGMASEAKRYLQDFSWCQSILESYFGDGCGGVVAVFLFRIVPSRIDIDEWLWVVVGDIPSAYLVTDNCNSPSQALEGYIDEMTKWVKLAKRGRSSTKVIPVNVSPTIENAEALEGRLKFLRDVLVPAFKSGEAVRS